MIIGVLACSKRKLSHPAPAVDLYQGDVFRLARAYLERLGVERLVVLSALHYAVPGEQIVQPYERSLVGASRAERRSWADHTGDQLRAFARGALVHAIVPDLYAPALYTVPHLRHFGGLCLGELRHALGEAAKANAAQDARDPYDIAFEQVPEGEHVTNEGGDCVSYCRGCQSMDAIMRRIRDERARAGVKP